MQRSYVNPAADAWYAAVSRDSARLPFAFSYDGREYRGFSPEHFTLTERRTERTADKETTELVFQFDAALTITLRLTHYFTHGATEWTVWFANPSDAPSAIIENVRSELTFAGAHPVLKGILGDHVNCYRPYALELCGHRYTFTADTGRATHVSFPYFNLEYGDAGVMLAIGWGGTWTADFSGDADSAACTLSAVNGLRTYLKPGERIRTALFLTAHYTVREEDYATNYWRDFFIRQSMPRANAAGEAVSPFSAACLASDTGLPNSDGSISERHTTWKPSLEKMIAEGVKVDYRWFDAGWYVRPDGRSEETDWWGSVGTWVLDPVKWPGETFLASTEYARAHGMKTLVWFEPERVTDPENLAANYGYDPAWAIRMEGNATISNNIGDPDCFRWTADRICSMLRHNRVELYREDNNCNAAALWQHLDALEGAGRQGITECKLIDAHYRLWDEIIACTSSYGGCSFVDSCASGGGRNDLESLRRGIPLLRSDKDRTSTALRLSMTTAFNRWIPFCGANTKEKLSQLALTGQSDPYVWRASYLPILNVDAQYVYAQADEFDSLRFGLNEWKRVAPYLTKELYVLTPWHTEDDRSGFTALCYFDPETEKGVLLAFRQENCVPDTLTVRLPFLSGRTYRLTDEDTREEILTRGDVTLHFAAPRTARLLWLS